MERVFEFKKVSKTTVTIDEQFLRISRKGLFNKTSGLTGEKSIKLDNILSVQFKEPGMRAGYIQFNVPGGKDKVGVHKAISDENAILFSSKEIDIAEELKSVVENYISNKSINQTNKIDPTEELRKYKALLDDDIITRDEFEAKKKKILGL
ncbi:DUF4429 domain-containing protein [Heyndrickxia ginsengihumi]|uniref:DUF4429 domain-containing protein n=1 Tax=Heyndrickxia ginsengihumi TaxID=363870 RepID=UPI0004702D00|nr:DUF4429 domain-containing protein [Heyndrickxia ginsengihumi]